MVDERGSDRCPRRPSDVESPSLLGSSEDHKLVPLSPLFLSPAPLRSVQEPGRVQQRPGALRCGRPLVQSPPCTHQTWHGRTNLWGTVDSSTCPSGCKELCEHATWPPLDEWDVQPTSGGSRNSHLLHQVVHDSRGWTSSVNMLLKRGSTNKLWVRPATRHRLQGRRR